MKQKIFTLMLIFLAFGLLTLFSRSLALASDIPDKVGIPDKAGTGTPSPSDSQQSAASSDAGQTVREEAAQQPAPADQKGASQAVKAETSSSEKEQAEAATGKSALAPEEATESEPSQQDQTESNPPETDEYEMSEEEERNLANPDQGSATWAGHDEVSIEQDPETDPETDNEYGSPGEEFGSRGNILSDQPENSSDVDRGQEIAPSEQAPAAEEDP